MRLMNIDAVVYQDGKQCFCSGSESLSHKVGLFEAITGKPWDVACFGSIEGASFLLEVFLDNEDPAYYLPAGFDDEISDPVDIIQLVDFALGRHHAGRSPSFPPVKVGSIYSLKSGAIAGKFRVRNNKIELLKERG